MARVPGVRKRHLCRCLKDRSASCIAYARFGSREPLFAHNASSILAPDCLVSVLLLDSIWPREFSGGLQKSNASLIGQGGESLWTASEAFQQSNASGDLVLCPAGSRVCHGPLNALHNEDRKFGLADELFGYAAKDCTFDGS